MIKFVFSFCTFWGLSHSALAWNAEGHMVVAQIAYNHLAPNVKAKCDTLIGVPVIYETSANTNFVTAACWADDIKSSTSAYSIWHYIDLPFSLDGTSTSGVAADTYDVVKAINLCIANLQNASLSQSNQAMNLRFLLHFVGDIQQPLHCSTAVSSVRPGGDAGGNTFYITSANWSNLHSLWDQGGGYLFDSISRPFTVASQNTINAKVSAIETDYAYNYSTNLGTIPDPLNWAQEGMGRAQTNCYAGLVQNATPSTAYLNAAMSTTEQLLANGGHRLADLLNTIFGSNPVTLKSLIVTNGVLGFSWNALSGTTYHVQWKQQLSDPAWNNLTNLTATGNSSISVADKLDQTQRFYRVLQ